MSDAMERATRTRLLLGSHLQNMHQSGYDDVDRIISEAITKAVAKERAEWANAMRTWANTVIGPLLEDDFDYESATGEERILFATRKGLLKLAEDGPPVSEKKHE